MSFSQETSCSDGVDNDGNGLTDGNDTSCICNTAITAMPNPVNIEDPVVDFTVDHPEYNLSWNFDDGTVSTSSNTMHRFDQIEGEHIVYLYVRKGACFDTTSVTILVDAGVVFYIPNAFTPDGDEFNNEFKPIFTSGVDQFDYTLKLFNRWGEVVFVSHDLSFGWDGSYNGSLSREGSYLWTVEYKDLYSDKRFNHNGQVFLTR